jgi:hypothetical protein
MYNNNNNKKQTNKQTNQRKGKNPEQIQKSVSVKRRLCNFTFKYFLEI